MSFNNLGLIAPILDALRDAAYVTPTSIQEKAIPMILNRRDLLACAQTGTGKTAAFTIPMLQLMHEDRATANAGKKSPHNNNAGIASLILAPTRELALQIGESIDTYGRYLHLKHLVIFGGVPQDRQVRALRSGVDILIATPGRLLDLINQRHINLGQLKFYVLDEADRMLDSGFLNDIRKINRHLPAGRQNLMFSATIPAEIRDLANSLLTDPVNVEVNPVSATADRIEQCVYHVEKKNKLGLLLDILQSDDIENVLVFTQMKHTADKVSKALQGAGIRSQAIHGNKSQGQRQDALKNFKDHSTRVLVATDIAARGIDIDSLSHVINFELPNVPETYVHRIGRTGRAGASGIAISFCDYSEKLFLRDIQKLTRQPIPVNTAHKYHLSDFESNSRTSPLTLASEGKPRRFSGQRRNYRGQATISLSARRS